MVGEWCRNGRAVVAPRDDPAEVRLLDLPEITDYAAPTAEELAAYLSNGTTEQSGDFADLRLHVQVRRDAKGLGVGVTSSNVIQSLSAGHVLQVGDQILGVDGERLAGRHLSQVLASSQAVYDFEVMRSDHVVGMTLRKVPPDHPILRPRARIDLLRVDLVRDSAGLAHRGRDAAAVRRDDALHVGSPEQHSRPSDDVTRGRPRL